MTHMPSPYQDASNVTMYQEPERTSIMAVLSMVLGIGGCCLGITSIPAILLGIFGLVGISRSRGRVGGTGFGIAGIIVGLLTLALWIGLFFGVGGAIKSSFGLLTASAETVLTNIQSDDFDAARSAMSPPASEVTAEQLAAFHEAYRASVGEYVGQPTGLSEWISAYMAIGQQIQPYQGKPGYVPLPLRFDSGWVLVIYIIDPASGSGNNPGVPKPQELIVVDAQGNEFRLPAPGAGPSSAAPPMPPVPDSGTDEGGEDQTPGDETADDGDDQGP